ncbi:MAG TPA: FAD-binding oxidoreductase [Candidatus Acidoferrum sp.]|nr:FAD-binding oxidoreductase [Candidatus Acidoferrum sp.]
MNEIVHPRRQPVPGDVLDRIKAAVGPKGWTDDAAALAPQLIDWRRRYQGRTPLLVRPGSTAEVAEVVRLCADARVPIVAQGGNTSLCGGSIPSEAGDEILLSLSRMNRVRGIDAANYTMTAEAGCVLAQVQEAASQADRLFPLSLAAEGSCQIGGNLSTNAGGITVLRYGNARELVLGLEVVLPDGQVWDGLRGLRKDNTGYDLKQLFLGAEGTLGIITAAVLKLFPKPRERVTAFVAVTDLPSAVELLSRCRASSGDAVTSFELLPRIGIDLGRQFIPGVVEPLRERRDYYVLIELTSAIDDSGLRGALEEALEQALEEGLIADATVAESAEQSRRLWFVRESIVELQKFAGASIKHDVSVAVSLVPAFMVRAIAAVTAALPGVRIVAFGHIGDGNVHFNLYQPEAMDAAAFLARQAELSRIVHDIVAALDGSISAEHGIGRLRRDDLQRYKPAIELELMRRIKQALDPSNIMNPGKVI